MTQIEEAVDRGLKAWHERDMEAFAGCYAEDAVLAAPGGMELHGRDGARQFFAMWNQACPDNRLEITSRYVDGDVLIEEGVFHGTQTGEMMTPTGMAIPPTGRTLSGDYADVFKLGDGGLIKSERLYFDQMQLLMQLGLVSEMEGAAAS